MKVVGVDVWKRGWVAIVLESGTYADAGLFDRFDRLLTEFDDAIAIAVDIPIGLPEGPRRPADIAARAFVGSRRNSVFFTPPRLALDAPTYSAARSIVPSLSAQSYALRQKILEVEQGLEERVFEVHPEVSFCELARAPLKWTKQSWNGLVERRQLLAAAGIVLPELLAAGAAPADDLLDAAVAAWSANRYAQGQALPFPEGQSGRAVIWR